MRLTKTLLAIMFATNAAVAIGVSMILLNALPRTQMAVFLAVACLLTAAEYAIVSKHSDTLPISIKESVLVDLLLTSVMAALLGGIVVAVLVDIGLNPPPIIKALAVFTFANMSMATTSLAVNQALRSK